MHKRGQIRVGARVEKEPTVAVASNLLHFSAAPVATDVVDSAAAVAAFAEKPEILVAVALGTAAAAADTLLDVRCMQSLPIDNIAAADLAVAAAVVQLVLIADTAVAVPVAGRVHDVVAEVAVADTMMVEPVAAECSIAVVKVAAAVDSVAAAVAEADAVGMGLDAAVEDRAAAFAKAGSDNVVGEAAAAAGNDVAISGCILGYSAYAQAADY
ncbi:unnamed protein product [Ilex paraguariensis]|uniref:Uncharacterized protein n=1 Tax=Ilex paraguariensis TaxID=185542 RepID=A0ABC8R2Q4_9AQUA